MSLDVLRGFESAARHLSFTAAAEELCVTQSAVSKQVRALEDIVGKPVFHRGSKGIGLTAEGRYLYEGVRAALDQLGLVLERAIDAGRARIAVTVTPSFASLWLVSRLAAFRDEEPGIDIHIDASEPLVALEREGFDLAVRLAPHGSAPVAWKPLVQELMMIVAAAPLAERIGSPQDLLRVPLLVFHDPRGRFPWMSWLHWFDKLGLAPAASQPVFHFSQYELLVKAAVEQIGVAIGRTPLILPFIADGSLRVVLPDRVEPGMTYHLVVSERAQGRDEVQRFSRWLERTLAEDAVK